MLFWVLVLCFRFNFRKTSHSHTHLKKIENLLNLSTDLQLYHPNTISHLKFAYDLCCVPHIFVMHFFVMCWCTTKKCNTLLCITPESIDIFCNASAHYQKIGALRKNGCITKNTWHITKKTGSRNLQTGPRNHKQEPLLLPSSFLSTSISILTFLMNVINYRGLTT